MYSGQVVEKMKTFSYKGILTNGKMIEGVLDASDVESAANKVRKWCEPDRPEKLVVKEIL